MHPYSRITGVMLMRQARKVAESGFYHVVTKGEAVDLLFFSNDDRQQYVCNLAETRDEFDLQLHSYCLMSNHVHLLVEDPEYKLSAAMKQLNEQYAIHYKRRCSRTGHVFKNRYWSEPIESDAYLLCAMRYIHANPAVAGICKASAYEWSSAKDYLGREGIANKTMLLDMLGGRDGFIQFSNKELLPAKSFPESGLTHHLRPDEVMRIAQSIAPGCDNSASLSKSEQNDVIKKLHASGLSITQIMFVTSLSRGRIRGAITHASH